MSTISTSRVIRRAKYLAIVLCGAGLCPALLLGQGAQGRAGARADKCIACHSAASLTTATSKYFEHYRTVHREAERRNLECDICHAPIAAELRKAGRVMRSACGACHKNEAVASGIRAATAHSVHGSLPGLSCASCHRGATHRIEMLQQLDTCSNCH